jgi:dTDP-4-amino-4,6-dideoxygalactose transaminase
MVEEFEESVAGYVGSRYAIATSSCTTALHLALLSVGVKPQDEVIVPSYTFIAPVNAILYCQARPRFVDIDLNTYNIDPDRIEGAVTKRTKAIIVVHQLGLPADIIRIKKVADAYGLKVIEDAACAIGSKYYSKMVGSLGDIACFSFHPKKLITTAEGGMITTKSKNYAELCRSLRNHGASVSDLTRHGMSRIVFESYKYSGYNYRMPDICAALGISQIKRIEDILEKRLQLAQRYNEALGRSKSVTIPHVPKYATHNYQSYNIILNDSCPVSREELMNLLLKKGISTRRIMAVHLEPAYSLKYGKAKLPNTVKAFRRALLLPIYNQMSKVEQEFVISSVLSLTQ